MNPFTPIETVSQHIVVKTISCTIGLLIKLPLFIILMTELLMMNDIVFKVIKLNRSQMYKKLVRIGILLHNRLVGRILLLVLGYWRYTTVFNKSTDVRELQCLQSQCIFANKTSPIDVLVYITYFSPTFTKVYLWKEKAEFKTISYSRAVWDSYFQENAQFVEERGGEPLADLLRSTIYDRRGPLILFYEGGVTNGYSLLRASEQIVYHANEIYKQWLQNKRAFNTLLARSPETIIVIDHNDKVKIIGRTAFWVFWNMMTSFQLHLDMYLTKVNNNDLNGTLEQFVTKFNRGLSDWTQEHFKQRDVYSEQQ